MAYKVNILKIDVIIIVCLYTRYVFAVVYV